MRTSNLNREVRAILIIELSRYRRDRVSNIQERHGDGHVRRNNDMRRFKLGNKLPPTSWANFRPNTVAPSVTVTVALAPSPYALVRVLFIMIRVFLPPQISEREASPGRAPGVAGPGVAGPLPLGSGYFFKSTVRAPSSRAPAGRGAGGLSAWAGEFRLTAGVTPAPGRHMTVSESARAQSCSASSRWGATTYLN